MVSYSNPNVSDCQVYKGTATPAVNRICLGVSPGEVCLVKLTPESNCVCSLINSIVH